MTTQQFNNQGFGAGDTARYKDGKTYIIASVDFQEQLIGLLMNIDGSEPNEISWVRCESVEYMPAERPIQST